MLSLRRIMGASTDLKKPNSSFSILNFANSPVLDENGSSTKLSNLWQKQTTMFIFLRHFGCISCRTHAKQVWSEREKYESKGSKIIFVGNGTPYFITKFKEDLGLQKAISTHYGKKYPISKKVLISISKEWSPYCTVATWFLWRALDPFPTEY